MRTIFLTEIESRLRGFRREFEGNRLQAIRRPAGCRRISPLPPEREQTLDFSGKSRVFYYLPMQKIIFFLALAGIAGTSMAATLNSEIYPGAFEAAKPGTQLITGYLYERNADGYYVKGQRQGGARLSGHAFVVSGATFGTTFGMTSALSVTVPYLQAQRNEGVLPRGFGNDMQGFGDPQLAYGIWPVNDPQHGRWLAVTGTLGIPVGARNSQQALNPGENRWKTTFRVAGTQYLTPTFAIDVAPEISYFGVNSDYVGHRMTQRPVPAVTSYLRWKAVPGWELYTGGQVNFGGDQTISDINMHNGAHARRIFFGASTLVFPKTKVGVRYSRDTSVNYELKTTSDWVLYATFAL